MTLISRCVPLLPVLALLLCAAPRAEDRFPGIEALMSAEEFRAAGLDKLSPAEREALDRWLLRYTATDSQVLRSTNEEVRRAEEEHEIRARIVQPFAGWTGDTRFVLDNGQVWAQRLDGRYHYGGEDTDVVIRKNFFGFYTMTLVATGRSVGVSRVE